MGSERAQKFGFLVHMHVEGALFANAIGESSGNRCIKTASRETSFLVLK